MFGGLSRALNKRREKPVQAAPEPEAPEALVDDAEIAAAVSLDEPLDPKLLNRPIEPGTGGPDLGSIMRRVRDERAAAAPKPAEPDAAKSDFIAAARRAAQAAAAEAEILKRKSDGATGPERGTRLADILGRRRKPILLAVAAVMIAIAGLQVGGAMLTEPAAVAVAEEPAPPAAADTDEPDRGTAIDDLPGVEIVRADAAAAPVMVEPAAEASGDVAPVVAKAAAPAPVVADVAAPAPVPEASATAEIAAAVSEAAAPALPAVPEAIEPPALREAAAAGDAKALFEIGARFAEGRGVAADMKEAATWLEASAALGFAPAQYRLGSFLEKGTGIERDPAKAKTWYQLAADRGNASAMHNLAVLHAMGADGATDNEAAARWFTAAAELGVKDSQFNLGILSAKGVGMERDLVEAYKWFALVAKGGDKDAASKRDEIANALKPEELARARAVTELWKSKPVDAEANTVEIPESWSLGPSTTASVDVTAAVKTIQTILSKNGYEPGGTDGVMGARTKAAIVAFQKDNDLSPTGEVDDKLVQALLARK